MAYQEITQGQTFPPLTVPLVTGSGAPLLPALGAQAFLQFRNALGGTTLGGQCVINSDGTVTYAWVPADVATAGIYWMRFKVVYAPGTVNEKIEYVPSGHPDTLRIFPT